MGKLEFLIGLLNKREAGSPGKRGGLNREGDVVYFADEISI
jgi:hypothetical protein